MNFFKTPLEIAFLSSRVLARDSDPLLCSGRRISR